MPRCDPGKIPGRRVASCTSSCAVEELLARLNISGLEIADVDAFPSAFLSERVVLLGMDERHQAGNLVIRSIKARHAFIWAPVAHYGSDVVSVYVRGHQLRPREIWSTFTASGIAAMAKRTV